MARRNQKLSLSKDVKEKLDRLEPDIVLDDMSRNKDLIHTWRGVKAMIPVNLFFLLIGVFIITSPNGILGGTIVCATAGILLLVWVGTLIGLLFTKRR